MKKLKKLKKLKLIIPITILVLLVGCKKEEEYLLSDLTPTWRMNDTIINDGSVIHIPKRGEKILKLTVSGVNDRQVIDVFLEIRYLDGGLYKKYKDPIATLVSSQVATSISFVDEKIGDYEAHIQFVSRKMNAIKYNRFIIRIDDGDTISPPPPPPPPPPPTYTYAFFYNGQSVVNGGTLTVPPTTCYLHLQVSGLQAGESLPVYRAYPDALGSQTPVFMGNVTYSLPTLDIPFGVIADHRLQILVGDEFFSFHLKVQGGSGGDTFSSDWVQLKVGEKEISQKAITISQNTYLELYPKKTISKMVVFKYEDEESWSGEFFGGKGFILFPLVYQQGKTKKLKISTEDEKNIELVIVSQ
jgi:hypothetical protein